MMVAHWIVVLSMHIMIAVFNMRIMIDSGAYHAHNDNHNNDTGSIFFCETVRQTEVCEKHSQSPVCSSRGEEFPSLCQLYLSKRTLAYRGHCKVGQYDL